MSSFSDATYSFDHTRIQFFGTSGYKDAEGRWLVADGDWEFHEVKPVSVTQMIRKLLAEVNADDVAVIQLSPVQAVYLFLEPTDDFTAERLASNPGRSSKDVVFFPDMEIAGRRLTIAVPKVVPHDAALFDVNHNLLAVRN